jgi:hypothetical protein
MGAQLNRLRKFVEQGPFGEGRGQSAYAFTASILPTPSPGMTWHPVADFSAAEELLQDPGLKEVIKAAIENGFAVPSRGKDAAPQQRLARPDRGDTVRTTYLPCSLSEITARNTSGAGGWETTSFSRLTNTGESGAPEALWPPDVLRTPVGGKMRLERLLKNATREEQQEQIRRKLRQIEMAFQMDRWMASAELQPPR